MQQLLIKFVNILHPFFVSLNDLIHGGLFRWRYPNVKIGPRSRLRFIGGDVTSDVRCTIGRGADIVVMNYDDNESQYVGSLVFGNNVIIGNNCTIRATGSSVKIGDGCQIANNVSLIGCNHQYDKEMGCFSIKKWDMRKTGVSIGENTWIGTNAVLLPGVSVGKNSVVGAGAIVTRSFPDNSFIVGSTARSK